ncbi:NUDIX hydrolase [Lentzea sp. NPDC004789]
MPAKSVDVEHALMPTSSGAFSLHLARCRGYIVPMAPLPIRDRAGNALVGFRVVTGVELDHLDDRVAVPAAVIVVEHAGAVLMMFDSWRRQWELPGGAREPGETPRQAAVRELREETGIRGVEPDGAAVAEFDLTNPDRHEFLAVYRVRLRAAPRLIVNAEALGFLWWPPSNPVGEDMTPLDAEIARRVFHSSTE